MAPSSHDAGTEDLVDCGAGPAPDVVQAALAEREAAIARGEPVPRFDADGFEITDEVIADG